MHKSKLKRRALRKKTVTERGNSRMLAYKKNISKSIILGISRVQTEKQK